MASFNLDNYETVKSRKKRFYADYPNGSIVVTLLNPHAVMEYALIMAAIYRNPEEQQKNIIFSTGMAHEIRDTELKQNKYGKEYQSVNYSSWCENCEESAIGRALDNAGYSGNDKCSREEMEKVKQYEQRTDDSKRYGPSAADKKHGDVLKAVDEIIQATNLKELDVVLDNLRKLNFTVEEGKCIRNESINKRQILEGL